MGSRQPSSESQGPHLPPANPTLLTQQPSEQSILTVSVPDLSLSASSHPPLNCVLPGSPVSKRCEVLSHATVPLTFWAPATATSAYLLSWILLPQTSGPLQMLSPLGGHLFSDTSPGKLVFAFGAHLNWHSAGRAPDRLDKVQTSCSPLSLAAARTCPHCMHRG